MKTRRAVKMDCIGVDMVQTWRSRWNLKLVNDLVKNAAFRKDIQPVSDCKVKKLDRNACVAELSKLHVHLPVKLPNDNSEVSCTVTLN
eukprot:759685-Hanusia_phi.AAC.1